MNQDHFDDELKKHFKITWKNKIRIHGCGVFKFDTDNFKRKRKKLDGNHSAVYIWSHEESGKLIAVKEFPFPLREKEPKNFWREIFHLQALSFYPDVVKFYGFYIDRRMKISTMPAAFIFMEYMEITLEDLYKVFHSDNKKVPQNLLAYIAISLVNALSSCEEKQIVHRDIKPSNIMINIFGEVKLCDFGSSRIEGMSNTINVGTIGYWPPERFDTQTEDLRNDVWSMGIAILEVAFGMLPHKENRDHKFEENTLKDHIRGYSTREKIHELIVKCLASEYDYLVYEFVSYCLKKYEDRTKTCEIFKNLGLYKVYNMEGLQEEKNLALTTVREFQAMQRVISTNELKSFNDPGYASISQFQSLVTQSSLNPAAHCRNSIILESDQSLSTGQNTGSSVGSREENIVNEQAPLFNPVPTSVSEPVHVPATVYVPVPIFVLAPPRNAPDPIQNVNIDILIQAQTQHPNNAAFITESRDDHERIIREVNDRFFELNPLLLQLEANQSTTLNQVKQNHRMLVEDTIEGNSRSIVRKAIHNPTQRVMAIKSVYIPNTRQESYEDKLRKLVNEIKILRDLSACPNIVTFYGLIIHDNAAHICMEKMEFPLRDFYKGVHKKLNIFPENWLGYINVAILDALVFCKRIQIIHRDIKPTNILLNCQGEIKLCDFGESRLLQDSLASTFVGTPCYWPPEHFTHPTEKYDLRSDVWSLGITLCETVSGNYPYAINNQFETSIFTLRKVIVNKSSKEIIKHCIGGKQYSDEMFNFLSLCLDKYESRPKFETLCQLPFYLKYKNIDLKNMPRNCEIVSFISQNMDLFKFNQVIDSSDSSKSVEENSNKNKSIIHPEIPQSDKKIITVLERNNYRSTNIKERIKGLFKINLNQGQSSTSSKSTSEYYEQLFNDPYVNKLAFTDGGPVYRFKFDDFVALETIATTRHIIKKMLHKKSGTVLAVKWVHIPHNRHSTDDENLKKLRQLVREVHNFRELRNDPNIVRFYGFCLYEGQALICMELMDLSLKDLSLKFIENGENFPEELLNCVIVAVLKALAACKAKNIMHRDVKPDNVLLGKKGSIKLIDFGESRVLENSMASTFVGSLTYWPPERFEAPEETNTEQPDAKTNMDQPDLDQGDSNESEQPSNSTTSSTQTSIKAKYDIRADIWSLGITLIEVVSGSVPYRDKKGNIPNNIILLQNLIINLNPNITVDERFNGYSEEIKDFVKSCLRKEKERPKYSDLLVTKFYKNLETIDSETLVKRVMEKWCNGDLYTATNEPVSTFEKGSIPTSITTGFRDRLHPRQSLASPRLERQFGERP